jgi:transposase
LSRGDLSEAEWRLLEPLLPPERGRKSRPAFDNRQIVNGILWRIRTGAPWRDLPEKYGKWMTIYQPKSGSSPGCVSRILGHCQGHDTDQAQCPRSPPGWATSG